MFCLLCGILTAFAQLFHLGWTAVDSVFDLATSLVADDRIAALFCSEVTAVAIYFIFISGQQLGCFCGVMDISCCCLHGMNQSAVPVNADMCLIAEVPGIAFLHLMCIRVPLLFFILGGRRDGNNGGIHDRSLFQNETSFHKCGNHLREQLLLQSVLDQQIAKTTKGISVRNLITGIDAAEIRKRTAVDHFCYGCLITQVIQILQQVQSQHGLQRIGFVAALSFVIARLDQA